MTFTPAPSDFYGFATALSDRERDHLVHLREALATHVAPIVDEHWERASFPEALPRVLAEARTIGLGYPETRPFENSAVFRGWTAFELARVDASTATFVGVQNGLALGSIGICGSEAQRAEWLPKLASCEVIGSFGLTEPLSGSDSARGLRSTARREGDEWVITGSKRWIGNATFGDITIVWATDEADGQVKGFIVPNDATGFTATKIERKTALRIVQNADITLDGVRVPHANKLEHADSFRATASVLRQTRAEVAWLAAGVAAGAYESALRYASERLQFGKPLTSFQLIQDHLVTCLGNVTASIAMCVRVSEMLEAGTQADEHSALAKAFVTSRMRETVALAREVCGGNGIVTDYGPARFFADAEAIYSYEGTREMNHLIVGRAITGHAAFV